MLYPSDSKAMAKALRKSLAARRIELSHGECLEIVAHQFGFANRNMLSARVERGALWMRADPAGGRPLRFDSMLSRATYGAIRGNVELTERSMGLDVPEEAATIHYGVMLAGGGELWACNFAVEAVDPASVAVTGQQTPDQPANLGFNPRL